jgi:hypothetical protein
VKTSQRCENGVSAAAEAGPGECAGRVATEGAAGSVVAAWEEERAAVWPAPARVGSESGEEASDFIILVYHFTAEDMFELIINEFKGVSKTKAAQHFFVLRCFYCSS